MESDRYRLRSKKLRLSVDDSLVRIDVEVPVSDVVVRVPISDGGVMRRTYGYSDGNMQVSESTVPVLSVNQSLSCSNGIDIGIIISIEL